MRLLLTTAIITTLAVPVYAGTALKDRAGTVSYGGSGYNSLAPASGYVPSPRIREFADPAPRNVTVPTTPPQSLTHHASSSVTKADQQIGSHSVILLSNAMSVNSKEVGQDTSPKQALKPRVEVNHRYSNDRAITMSEFWVPLAQNIEDGSVLFGDVRLMGDNNENNEFNIGAGYREIVNTSLLGDGIIGGMVWYDRRLTKNDSDFNQITAGAEWLGEDWDVRVNGYLPLNDSETFTQANPNGSGSGFVGNQVLVNTDQTLSEEALAGGDIEIGYRLPFLDGITDATRIYAGGYHFAGDKAEDVSGWRARFTSDITSDVQIGARYQHDDVRGSQTYLEATVRFPFKAKKSFQEEGLRSRLDEAPERDIDIVSNEAVIDEGLINTTLLNATTGAAQNIIHVDNTNGAGTGTAADPFNTLAAAQAAAGVNDMIYVHRGDGTTTGMNAGITLDDAGQMLAGSGADLMFSADRFRVSGGRTISQAIVDATTAPVITNTGGSGVIIDADNVTVSGITVDGAAGFGITAMDDENVVIDGVTSQNSNSANIWIQADTRDIENVTVKNSLVQGSVVNSGIAIRTTNNSVINNVMISNNVSRNNRAIGFQARADTGRIENIIYTNNLAKNNGNDGFSAIVRGSSSRIGVQYIGNVSNGDSAQSSAPRGFRIENESGEGIDVTLRGNTVSNNPGYGIAIINDSANGVININGSLGSNSVYNNGSPLFFDPN